MKLLIKGAIRKSFRLTPQYKNIMKLARRELGFQLKKDGTVGKKINVKYECASCKQLFPQKWVQVDHINPSVPLDTKELDMSYDELARGICCDESNLQVLCSVPLDKNENIPSCHRYKSNTERYIRDRIKEMKEAGTFTELSDELLENLTLDYKKYLIDKELEKLEKSNKKKVKK